MPLSMVAATPCARAGPWCATIATSTHITTVATVIPLSRHDLSHRPVPHQLDTSFLLRSSFFSWDCRLHIGSPFPSIFSSRDWLRLPRTKSRSVVHASILGVGAPEALVIAVVALLVFGPKGLAEVARTLGKSLRAFQPTIRELQQISRDFKDTLEQEIGLDELRSSGARSSEGESKIDQQMQTPSQQNGTAESKAYSTEDYVRITEEQAKALVPEEQRKAAEAAAWGGTPPTKEAEGSELNTNVPAAATTTEEEEAAAKDTSL